MAIPQVELEKALEAFSQAHLGIEQEFVYKAKDTSGRDFLITRERACALALQRFKELRKVLNVPHND